MVGGPRRKGKIISEQEKKITAYHEGGHALAAWAMPDLEPVYKLTILPRGRTGGHALVVPEDDKGLMTRSEMIGRLVFAMGGRSAEELVFHEPTTGASSDIDQATKIARAMVTEYGMSAQLGAVRYGREQGDPFLGRSMGNQPDYSLEVAHEIDEEVRKLIEAAHTEAWEILNTYRDVLDDLAFELLEKETLHPQGPRADLRPGREAAAHHRVQRLRRPHAVGQAADQDARRAGQGARRAVAARHRPRAHARRLLPGRQRHHRAAALPRRLPDRPAAVVRAARTPRRSPRSPRPCRTTTERPPGGARPTTPAGQTWPPPPSSSSRGRSRAAGGHQRQHAAGDPTRPRTARADQGDGVDHARAEAAVRELLIAVGEDPEREGLRETPARVARAYAEIFAGLYTDPDAVLDKTFDENHQELILVKDIPIFSCCEHHLVPFHGVAHVGYIPGSRGRVTGLSKLARVVDLYARRPQVQERLTGQVADAIVRKLEPRGVIVVIEAEHLCMGMRGIRKPGRAPPRRPCAASSRARPARARRRCR